MLKKKILPPRRKFGDSKHEGILQDAFPMIRGEFHVLVNEIQPDGSKKVVEEYSEKNLIVANAPAILANCLAGVNTNYGIGFVQWGTGGHVSGDPSTPVPPDVADTALETYVLSTAVDSPPTIGTTYVQFEAEMDTATGNGNVFTEAGLVTANASSNLMFARKTFPGITKTSDRTLTVRWIISFIQTSTGSDCQGVGLFGQLTPIRQYRYTVPAAPASYTEIIVPLVWPSGLNRLFVYRNGKRIFNGETYTEDYPTGIISITPAMTPGEVFTFEVME